jgi:DNA polymerase-3 subunit gamma/tau
MSYQVIARKYRPQRFSEVVGQEHVTRTLANAIAQNRIAHAYLFCGPRGTGKTTIARIFAKCLNATNGPTVEFSDDDPRCREIAEGRSLDVLEIDAASNRGIDEIRSLRETVHYAPAQSRFRIYIIDEVHMLTREAFNALLKTLEEPPDHVKFMFATTEPEKVPATILSRCQRFDLRRIPTALMVRHLAHIARLEGVEIDEAALYAIARGADGGLRDAESTLDQLISFCGRRIQESDVLSMYGLTARDQLLGLSGAILRGDRIGVVRLLDRLLGQGKDPGRLLGDLVGHFRNLMVWQLAGDDAELLDLSEAERAALREQAGLVTWEGAARIVEVLADAENRLGDAVSRQVMLEVALLRAIEARQAVSLEYVLEKLRALRNGLDVELRESATNPGSTPSAGGFGQQQDLETAAVSGLDQPVPDARPASATAAAAGPEASEAAPASTLTSDEAFWARLLDTVGRASPFLRSYLEHAYLARREGQRVVIGFPREWQEYKALADTPQFRQVLETKLRELGMPTAEITFVVADPPVTQPSPGLADAPATGVGAGGAPQTPEAGAGAVGGASGTSGTRPAARARKPAGETPAPPLKLDPEEFKNDPLIRQALEMFKARIVKQG